MRILVVNVGSSSIKLAVYDSLDDSQHFKAEISGFKEGSAELKIKPIANKVGENLTIFVDGIDAALEDLTNILGKHYGGRIDAVGHRVAHGGADFTQAVVIDDNIIHMIEDTIPLAPLHAPVNLKGINIARKQWPDVPHVAVFDTAFHHTIPEAAHTYAVPKEWREKGLRRYGFHGTSHKYVAFHCAQVLKRDIHGMRIISCHLGNGSSICAVNRGFSLDTSMGMTPLEGLVMGTRSGDVDPGVFTFLSREMGLSVDEVENVLYKKSGLAALSGVGNDLRDVEKAAAEGNLEAQMAIDVYAYRVRKYIGAYAAQMGGVDAIVFTGGVGENSAAMRRRICDRLEFLGVFIDENANNAVRLDHDEAPQIQKDYGAVKVLVTQSREQFMIAKETKEALEKGQRLVLANGINIPIAVSARHVHLSQETVEQLFGKGHQLTKFKDLAQPSAWAAEECVDVIGPKGELTKLRVVGPTRSANQIEVSRTDTFKLGVDAPVRPSGKIEGTPIVKMRGPKGEVETNGLIIAERHIHMNEVDARVFHVLDGDYVDVRVMGGNGEIVFCNVLVRVSDQFITEMHIDTDEANASRIPSSGVEGEMLFKAEGTTAGVVSSHKSHI